MICAGYVSIMVTFVALLSFSVMLITYVKVVPMNTGSCESVLLKETLIPDSETTYVEKCVTLKMAIPFV